MNSISAIVEELYRISAGLLYLFEVEIPEIKNDTDLYELRWAIYYKHLSLEHCIQRLQKLKEDLK